jgi:hypothetical protein
MTDYNKQVPFPRPYTPGANDRTHVVDPFGNTMRGAAGLVPQSPAPTTGGGGGTTSLDLDVYNGRTLALMSSGTATLTAGGRNIFWIQIDTNNNGTNGFMLVLGSLPYT